MNKFWYKLLNLLLKPVYKFYYNPKIYCKENLNIDGPIIIAGNHIHLMDQCNVIISSKRVINYMAKKEYFDSFKTRWFFKLVGCIPVDRSKKDKNAKNSAEKLLPFKYGAVSMARETNATIIPVAVTGDYKFRSKSLKAKFGKPFKVGQMSLEIANNKLYNEISKMIDELKS